MEDAGGRRNGRCGCAGEGRKSVPRRPRACGKPERLKCVVQGDCAAPRRLPIEEDGSYQPGGVLSTSLVELDLRGNDIEEGGGRALAETLRLNTTLTSLNLGYSRLGEIGWRALAETLRLNTTLTSLNLGVNGLGQG
jgi:hypothetical protein